MNPPSIASRSRALNPEDKSERRAAIVAAAQALLAQHPQGSFPIESVAQAARVAKGTVYLYFRSREEVMLAVHEKQVHELFDVIADALAARGANAASVVRIVLRHIARHRNFYPLAGRCRSMLDTKVGAACALEFKTRLGERLADLGEVIERMYPGLAAGAGAALLMNSYALMIGLWQQADPPDCLREVMKRPEMKIFRIDFERQLSAALIDLWDAAGRRGAATRRPGKTKRSTA